MLSFPNPVNEKAARTVAAAVVVLSALTVITRWYWLTVPLAYGFWARTLTGPRLSPLGWCAQVVLGLLIVAAGLESSLGLCLGCRVFRLLIMAGLVPEAVCAECADISGRVGSARGNA